MLKTENKKAQAALELAVFGSVLIFILGSIVRSALSNSYTQDLNFQAMRVAMLNSWTSSTACTGEGCTANGGHADLSHNTASVLILEDRLSPDYSKYGDVDRQPYFAMGSGTFSYMLDYPWQAGADSPNSLNPVTDYYINGQHFAFTTAIFVSNRTLSPPSAPPPAITVNGSAQEGPFPFFTGTPQEQQNECLQNQKLRQYYEWVGDQATSESQFDFVVPAASTAAQQANGNLIFNKLVYYGLISNVNQSNLTNLSGYVTLLGQGPVASWPSGFISWFDTKFPTGNQTNELNLIWKILQLQIPLQQMVSGTANTNPQYLLFFTPEVNGTPQFKLNPPSCDGANQNEGLCSSLSLGPNIASNPGGGQESNANGDLMYDLQRLYMGNNAVEAQFPLQTGANPENIRNYIDWQWAATPATTTNMIGINPSVNRYPSYDIDGRLKAVTIYSFTVSNNTPTVSYEDFDAGDIDSLWDSNSCGPKPGLLNDTQIMTYTSGLPGQGKTYLRIKEGGLYNPETNQFVRSVNKRDNIDLITRIIQLSNNNWDFCDKNSINACNPTGKLTQHPNGSPDPNPVEACVNEQPCNCFMNSTQDPQCGDTITETCYDTVQNIIYVRSRIQDQRGHYWYTNTLGQMQVKK